MKTNTFNLRKLAIFSFLVSIIFSCSTIKELEYNVPQNPLHMKGGDVTLQINGKFVEKGINLKELLKLPQFFSVLMVMKFLLLLKSIKGQKLLVMVKLFHQKD